MHRISESEPIQIFRSIHPQVFLRKGVPKICSTFTGEHPCCIFSEHLFLRTAMVGCFYILYRLTFY